MKKAMTWLFAGLLFVPTFAGCGESSEAVTNEDDGTSALGDQSDEDYEKQMMEAQAKEKESAGE